MCRRTTTTTATATAKTTTTETTARTTIRKMNYFFLNKSQSMTIHATDEGESRFIFVFIPCSTLSLFLPQFFLDNLVLRSRHHHHLLGFALFIPLVVFIVCIFSFLILCSCSKCTYKTIYETINNNINSTQVNTKNETIERESLSLIPI